MAGDIPFSDTLRGASSDASAEAKAELEILRALAAGKNPMTGASLPDDSCYQSAKVLRALLAAINALEKSIFRARALPRKTGTPWSSDEDKELETCFDQGMSIRDLAQKHERTRGGIESRLEKLGKVTPSYKAADASAIKRPLEQK